MLGPELLNLTLRPTPIFLEGTASLRIDQPGPRELGLTNFQVVKGLVSLDRGQFFINLAGVNQPLLAPDYFKRYLGQQIFFKVQITSDGATVLRPVPEKYRAVWGRKVGESVRDVAVVQEFPMPAVQVRCCDSCAPSL